MGWMISSSAGSKDIAVLNAPSLDQAYAVEAYGTPQGVRHRGDGLARPAPMRVSVGVSVGSFGALVREIRDLIRIARAEGTLSYSEGAITLSRGYYGLAAWRARRVDPERGVAEIELELLPKGPYWSGPTGEMIWGW